MEPVSLIAAALGAGALAGAGAAASQAVSDAYQALKSTVSKALAGRPAAEAVLAEHEQDPETYERALEKKLSEAGVGNDPRIVQLARALMEHLDGEGVRAGRYTVDLQGSQGVQVGDGNTQTNTFNS